MIGDDLSGVLRAQKPSFSQGFIRVLWDLSVPGTFFGGAARAEMLIFVRFYNGFCYILWCHRDHSFTGPAWDGEHGSGQAAGVRKGGK